ncbi:hypothetical protein HIM_07467 [Hirsutella minnesotensis 3608]|uniref:DDE-1 domain-containing protein n=1 Tax=Hirsutella minnesotensis 3608 TaxID=1043627 RepID=A0A0F7ZTG7_9HYPO|nr:hypothetical protein HIM_07467 [Hirsutella minnesotensis 3608]
MWLKNVYLPQTAKLLSCDSDARLLILDGHGSHTSDEFMALCFFNNVYLCFLPAHTSHGLQPLDNGVFNATKTAYRKELSKLARQTDSVPVDKINFIRCYAKARKESMSKKNILAGWRATGNWPINRTRALTHPEVQQDRKATPEIKPFSSDPMTPSTSRQLHRLQKPDASSLKRTFRKISRAFERKEAELVLKDRKIQDLEATLDRMRPKKKKKIPNPNKRFMDLSDILGNGKKPSDHGAEVLDVIEVALSEVDEEEGEEMEKSPDLPPIYTRAGRHTRKPTHQDN